MEKVKQAWQNYAIAIEVNKKSEQVQMAMLLTVIGEEARELFTTFTWEAKNDQKKLVQC